MADETTVTSNSNTIPTWAAPVVGTTLGQSLALSQTPYQPYTGQRLEDFSGLQNQSFANAANMQAPQQYGAGSNLAQHAGIAGLNTGTWTQPGVSDSYMSPYMSGVVDVQNQELMRNAEMQRNSNQARAVQAGAYGGSRHGLVDSEMYRNTMQQMNNNWQTGLQSAYQQGMGQYNADRSAGIQGLGVANQSAGVLGQLGASQQQANMGITSLQNQFGAQQQALGQQGRDIDYQNFQNQQQHPYNQMNFLNGIMRGYPVSGSYDQTKTQYEGEPSSTSTGLGYGLAGLSFFRSMGWI